MSNVVMRYHYFVSYSYADGAGRMEIAGDEPIHSMEQVVEVENAICSVADIEFCRVINWILLRVERVVDSSDGVLESGQEVQEAAIPGEGRGSMESNGDFRRHLLNDSLSGKVGNRAPATEDESGHGAALLSGICGPAIVGGESVQ
jgi:hypothetical protein